VAVGVSVGVSAPSRTSGEGDSGWCAAISIVDVVMTITL
jgi:hypothetical protein